MSVQPRIESDLKTAMRSQNALARDTLRMVIAAFKNRRIELGGDLTEADEIAVLQKAHKSRLDSAEQYDAAGRPELAERERAEAALVESYLPQQLGEDETRALVERLVAELGIAGKQDIGRLMKTVMAEHKGQVDGKLVQRIAGELLG
jgi:hypothetical protein